MGWEDYWEHMQEAEIDGVMIGRGALIKPWLFTEIKEKKVWDISARERLDMLGDFCKKGMVHWGSDDLGIAKTRRFFCEWQSFLCRYIPAGLLEVLPQRMNAPPPPYRGRDELETLLSSGDSRDWVKISEMFLGPSGDNFRFVPKHKSNSYESAEG